ncbi:MAG: phytoene desaturase family protein [Acidimicrobiales bacterium]
MESDVIVVGAGHNALACAAYLAAAGLRVVVLEARDRVGGNTSTEELTLPGWHHDTCASAHVVIQSNPLIADDELGLLEREGLRYLVTDPAVVFPLEGDDALAVRPDLEATAREFARFSPRDAAALRDMMSEWDAGLRGAHARHQAGLDPAADDSARRYDELRSRSALEVVESTFRHPVVRAAMTWLGFSTIQPPTRVGTGALPAAITAGRLRFGWATPVGGSQALPDALASVVRRHGGLIATGATARRYLVEDGRCVGVATDTDTYRARLAVVAGSHLATLPVALGGASPILEGAADRWRGGLAVFAVHFALRESVRYRVRGEEVTSVAAGLGTPDGVSRQVAGALGGRVDADDPWLLLVDSTAVDPARAPGAAFKFLTVAPTLVDGAPWTAAASRDFADHLVDVARRRVVGLDDANILARVEESPTSLAARSPANLAGSCHGGEFVMLDGRVLAGWPDVRTDVAGLYLTGSTSHPGGSVSGRPGRNAARVVLEDLGHDVTAFYERP